MINRICAIIVVVMGLYAILVLENADGAILCYCMAIFGLVLDIHIKKVKE